MVRVLSKWADVRATPNRESSGTSYLFIQASRDDPSNTLCSLRLSDKGTAFNYVLDPARPKGAQARIRTPRNNELEN